MRTNAIWDADAEGAACQWHAFSNERCSLLFLFLLKMPLPLWKERHLFSILMRNAFPKVDAAGGNKHLLPKYLEANLW